MLNYLFTRSLFEVLGWENKNMISTTVLWFILALIVAGAEMFTGTVYLLAVAVACAAGG